MTADAEKACSFGKTVTATKENLIMTNSMATAKWCGRRRRLLMKAIGNMESRKDLVLLLSQMAKSEKDISTITN